MRKRVILFLFLGAVLLPQTLLARFADSDIYKSGTFPNGVEYFLVSNSSSKGVADIALVQKQPGDVRSLLDSLDGMGGRSPAAYLADRGVSYTANGYAFREGDATVWNFRDVPVGASMDSTLFLLSNIIKSSPVTSTLIMCGDINSASIADRMGLLLMSVPSRLPSHKDSEYVWHPKPQRSVKYVCNGKEHNAVIIISFAIPRLPENARATVQPFLCRFFSRCLTSVLRERMSTEFKRRGIAFSNFKGSYLDSFITHGDESYTFSFRVSAEELGQATTCAASVMSGLDRYGVNEEEFVRINSRLLDNLVELAKTSSISNGVYVRNCLNACLNGASLASVTEIKNYVEQRQFGMETVTHFFNVFTSALLDNSRNASFTFLTSSDPDVDKMMERFDNGWNYPVTFSLTDIPAYEDVFHRTIAPARVRREVSDKISGGTMWKFSNGMRVIFKRTSGGEMMDYCLVIRGGIQNISNPAPGETAFVQDMFGLCGVNGMSHSDFDITLASKGISLKSFADFNGLSIRGKIPSSELRELPTVLASLKNLTLPTQSDVEYYRKCVRTGDENPATLLNYKIDALLRPEDRQLEYKFSYNLTDSTAIKALEYYRKQFSKMNDGVLMIFGDLDPEEVWRTLFRTLGAMPTRHRPEIVKWNERPQISAGVNMLIDTSSVLDLNSARIRIKFSENVSMKSNFTFLLASMCIKETMEKLLRERGFFVKSDTGYSLYPEDTFTATYDIIPCKEASLPKHVGTPSSILDAIADIHTGLRTGDDLATGRLDLYKTILTSRVDQEVSDERKLIAYTLLRYTSGKNMTGDYKAHIGAVTEAQVRDMATKILNSGRVEYIVR